MEQDYTSSHIKVISARVLDLCGQGQPARTIDIVLLNDFYKQNERCKQSLIRRLLITCGISMCYIVVSSRISLKRTCTASVPLPRTPSFSMLHDEKL